MGTVAYDSRSLVIDGARKVVVSGAVHYPRSTPALWPKILSESRKAGLNCIETYIFWNGHERQEGRYDFSGRYDLREFLRLCREEGLYAILRIGPYVCAETDFGGFPWWLIGKKGLVTRTWNKPFMEAVERWLKTLLAQVGDMQITRGGPVILAQMENEYNNVASRYGDDGRRYLAWCAEVGRAAGLEVPQIMCEGAPEGLIETLNGFSVWSRVADLRKHRPGQPALWTEHWPAWYDTWGEPHHVRTGEDIAYEVLRFFAVGGTGVNYYMWHGGTNFGRDAMFLQATSYDFDAPIDEYGMPTAKSEHLRALHEFLRERAAFFLEGAAGAPEALVKGEREDLADAVVLHPFRLGGEELAIVVNGSDRAQDVSARGVDLSLARHAGAAIFNAGGRWSVAYRTSAAPAKPIRRRMAATKPALRWRMLAEPLPGAQKSAPAEFEPVDLPHNMLHATRNETDFGWYRTVIKSRKAGPVELAARAADFLSVWVNGRHVGTVPERLNEDRPQPSDFDLSLRVPLAAGANDLLVLVTALGLVKGDWMIGAPQSDEKKGLLSAVTLSGREADLHWEFSPGLWGERVRLFDPACAELAPWKEPRAAGQPLRWYRAPFDLAARDLADGGPWAIEIGALRKGAIWINGRSIGRYWQVPAAGEKEARYIGHPHIANVGCGEPVQRYYHIPPDWLRPGRNVLVVSEERGAVPTGTRLVRRH